MDYSQYSTIRTPSRMVLRQILRKINNNELRMDISHILASIEVAEIHLGKLNLLPYEDENCQDEGLTMWKKVRYDVRAVLLALRDLSSVLKARMGKLDLCSDDDLDFDLDITIDSDVDPIRDKSAAEVDAVVSSGQTETIRHATACLGEILGDTINLFATRMRTSGVVKNRWQLLSDLQELRGRCANLLSALRFTMLEPFTDISREEIAPNYHTEKEIGLLLRKSLADLRVICFEIVGHATSTAEEKYEIANEIVQIISDYIGEVPGKFLRSPDRRAFLDSRMALTSALKDKQIQPIDNEIEGFIRFLEALRMINHREAVVEHDRELVPTLITEVDNIQNELGNDRLKGLEKCRTWQKTMYALYGKEAVIDSLIRDYGDRDPALDEPAVLDWRLRLFQTLLSELP